MKSSTKPSSTNLHQIMSTSSYNEEALPSFSRYNQLKQYKLAKKLEVWKSVDGKNGPLK